MLRPKHYTTSLQFIWAQSLAESFVGLCRVELVAVETIHDDHVRLVNTIAWTPWTPCISCPYFSLQPAAILQSIDSLHRGSVGVKMVEHWSQAKFLSHFVPEVLIMLYHFIQVRMISRFKGLRLTAGRRPSNLGTMLALCWPYVGPMLALCWPYVGLCSELPRH